jgi:hypothetical protein
MLVLAMVVSSCGDGLIQPDPPLPPPPPPTPAPKIVLGISPSSINEGQTSTLTWSSTNCTSPLSASGDWTGTRPASGDETVKPERNSSYSLSCTGVSGSDTARVDIVVVAKPPEVLQASFNCSVIIERAEGGAVTPCRASVSSNHNGDVTSLATIVWTSDGGPAGTGAETGVSVAVSRPNLISTRICVLAKTGLLEVESCKIETVWPRQKGSVVVADSSASEPLVDSFVLRSSSTAVDTARVGADMRFYFPGSTALAFGYEFVPSRPSYHPARTREVVSIVAGREVEVLAIPYSYCLTRGKYAGQCSNIELAWVHKRGHPIAPWDSYYFTDPNGGEPSYYPFIPSPVRVGFKRGEGYLPITSQDSAFVWGVLKEYEWRMGESLFLPEGSAPLNAPLFQYARYQRQPGGIGSHALLSAPNCVVMASKDHDSDSFVSTRIIIHETMHCFGIGHLPGDNNSECFWPSPMAADCGVNSWPNLPPSEHNTEKPKIQDVVHVRLLRLNQAIRAQGRIMLGIEESWHALR